MCLSLKIKASALKNLELRNQVKPKSEYGQCAIVGWMKKKNPKATGYE